MASFLDFLKSMADEGGGSDDQAAAPSPAQPYGANPIKQVFAAADQAQAAPPQVPPQQAAPVAPAPAPVADPNNVVAPASDEIVATAHRTPPPPNGVQLQLPKTAADQPVNTDRVPGDNMPGNYTPEEMASSKTPMSDDGKPIEHKGAFGIHGTARNILGLLGDAFLVQGGGKAEYAPHMQQEKESDALVGFAANPAAAIGRLAAVNPDAGIKLQSQVVNQELAQGRVNMASKKLGAVAGANAMKQYGNAAAAYAGATTPEAKQAANDEVARIREAAGLDTDTMPDLTDTSAGVAAMTYTPTTIQKEAQIAQTGSHQKATEQVAQQNADTSAGRAVETTRHDKANERISAGKGPAAKNPTNASMAAPVMSRVQAAMRKGQAPDATDLDTLQRLGYGTTSKAKASPFGTGAQPTAAPAAPKLPAGATTHGLSPDQVKQGYIMWNGIPLRPKKAQ